MLGILRLILLMSVLVAMVGCGSHDPVWRMKAQLTLLQLQQEQAAVTHPEEFASVSKAFQQGEQILTEQSDDELADRQFVFAYQKGQLLKSDLELYRARMKEEALQKEIEERAVREEEARIRLEAERLRQLELLEAQKKLQLNSGVAEKKGDTTNHLQQPASYTVRRGETLPQIAARPELYGDAALWPLIYRANRDQIRDPYQLWPGQVLKIPRNFSSDEALEARRQAHRKGR